MISKRLYRAVIVCVVFVGVLQTAAIWDALR